VIPMPGERPAARRAGPELLALARWEDFCAWFLAHTGGWPRSTRFTLAQRLQNHALEVAEALVVARFDRRQRATVLGHANLTLERMRLLLRLARAQGHGTARSFERAARDMDEVGRMLHGWRTGAKSP